jgi:hypothetical protein
LYYVDAASSAAGKAFGSIEKGRHLFCPARRVRVPDGLGKTISRTAIHRRRSIADTILWPEIDLLIHADLALSFSSVATAHLLLPEIFHAITLLAGTGSLQSRGAVYGQFVNLMQALASSSAGDFDVEALRALLSKASTPAYEHLFGLRSVEVTADEEGRELKEFLPPGALDTIVGDMLKVIESGAPSVGKLSLCDFWITLDRNSSNQLCADLANVWRARWMSLVTSMCFASNPSLQSRAFLVLGHLVSGQVDEELLYQCFVSLGKEIQRHEDGLAASIMLCIAQILRSLDPDSEYRHRSFWMAMACLQLSSSSTLLPPAIALLSAVLDGLDDHDGHSEVPSFLPAQPVDEALKDAAESGPAGVRFEPHFSFAVTTLLLRGLKRPSSQSSVVSVLRNFLHLASRGASSTAAASIGKVPYHALGFMVALLPSSARRVDDKGIDELLNLFGIKGVSDDPQERGYMPMLDYLDVPDNEPQLLIGAESIDPFFAPLPCRGAETSR